MGPRCQLVIIYHDVKGNVVEVKLYINQFDGSPQVMGDKIVTDFQLMTKHGQSLDDVIQRCKDMKVVSDETGKPTQEDIISLKPWANLSVSDQNASDWYYLVRNTQQSLRHILNCGYFYTINTVIPEIEYFYTFDLIQKKFRITTDNDSREFEYALDAIPDNWIELWNDAEPDHSEDEYIEEAGVEAAC